MKKLIKFIACLLLLLLIVTNLNINIICASTTIDNNNSNEKVLILGNADYDNTGNFKTCDKIQNYTLSISARTEQTVINKIVQGLRNTQTTVDLSSYNIPIDDLSDLIYKSFNADLLTYNCYTNITVDALYNQNSGYTENIEITYGENASTFKSRYSQLSNAINKIIDTIDPSMNDLEKALYLHDYIIKNTAYDYNNYIKNSVPLISHTAYNILVNHVGVCDGYSNAYKLLLDKLGINSIVVTSTAMDHAWNMIEINNKWYHVDLVADDYAPDVKGLVYHDYFLKTDTEIGQTHYGWQYITGTVPSASSTDFSSWFMHNVNSEAVYNSGYWYYPLNGAIYKSNVYGTNKSIIKYCNTSTITSYENKLYYNSASSIMNCDFNGNNNSTFYTIPNVNEYSNIKNFRSIYISNNGLLTATLWDNNTDTSNHEISKQITNNTNNTSNCSTNIKYSTQVQNKGWLPYSYNGETNGTIGKSLRLESIKIAICNNHNLGVSYSTQVQHYGWQQPVSNNTIAGTVGQALRMETISINLTGSDASKYDIYYRVHVQNYGWLGWAKNGEISGTVGYSLRIEAIEIILANKGSNAPGNSNNTSYCANPNVLYQSHIQSIGWQNYMINGQTSGTTGKSLRLEATKIKLTNQNYSGSIKYQSHIQNIGWQSYKENNELSGTTGKSLRLEAIKIELTGELKNHYDIYYRVHAQHFGWLGWAKNGVPAGTSGFGYRLESMQIVLVKKGANPPGTTHNTYINKN